jgi:hypothetical protein
VDPIGKEPNDGADDCFTFESRVAGGSRAPDSIQDNARSYDNM